LSNEKSRKKGFSKQILAIWRRFGRAGDKAANGAARP
jgi:hypothetical protein